METQSRILRIVHYPAPVLRKKAAPIDRVTPEIARFMDEMVETMYADNGVGLAAPQVGISLRIIVVDVGDGPLHLVNPVIIAREGSQTGVEGCLSLPNLHGDVVRAMKVTVRALNIHGKKVTLSGEGLWARAMQHEIDHLDGILFTDHVDPATLHWVTTEEGHDGDYIERPTTLEDALHLFEREASLMKSS